MGHARVIALLSFAVIGIVQAVPACAQAYPTRPIRMVVGFPPGGFTDILARQVSDRLTPVMGQQIVVDNRGGQAGIIGADIVAKSKPDGYTLLMGHNNSNAVAPSLYAKLPYDVRKDFVPIALSGSVATVLVVHPSVPAKTMKEFIAVVASTKGQFRVASAGVGSTQHLAIERFKLATGTQLIHVPYKGSGPAISDLVAGQIQSILTPAPGIVPQVQGGKLRALAVTSDKRSVTLPDVPTFVELGFGNLRVYNWYGVLAPAQTPPEIIVKLNMAIRDVMAIPAVLERLNGQLLEPINSTPQEFKALLERDAQTWANIVKTAQIKPE